jgi:hypothetical protein
MDMARKFLEMGFTRAKGMRIIIVGKNTIRLEKSDLKNLIGELQKKREQQRFSKW